MPQSPPPGPFPILAFVAPIIAAALMWAFTRSPFVLMFAVLGPIIALATRGDSRRRARADLRQQRVKYEQDFEAAFNAIDEAHDGERTGLENQVSRSSAIVTSAVRDSERWRSTATDPVMVRLGVGRTRSSVVFDEDPTATQAQPAESSRRRSRKEQPLRSIDELRQRARTLDHAPVVVDARLGIGVCGSRAEATAVATSIAVQLVAALSPLEVGLDANDDALGIFQWTALLPHTITEPSSGHESLSENSDSGAIAQLSFRPRDEGAPMILCVADNEHSLPRDCRVVINVVGSRARVLRHPGIQFTEPFAPDYISDRQARHFAGTLQDAARGSYAQWTRPLPERLSLSELRKTRNDAHSSVGGEVGAGAGTGVSRNSLAATVALGGAGPVTIDLVKEGPHAIVGGTTGSGKSEVLVTWVLALAAEYRPSDVNFLLIDFKGGAAFAPVQGLPHTVGVLTDLDPSAARRAILSLQAELQRRERVIAEAQVRSIAELPQTIELPRLLIVVDEFAAMATSFGEMHDLFADLAARGRSLGIHLILCTQRPAGTIRDGVLANCTLRVSLRVNNAADSSAVVGTPDAARIPKDVPGRSLLLRGGADVESVQWAMAGGVDARKISALSEGHTILIQRPWLDPLPDVLDREAVPTVPPPAIAFGLVDIPEEQRQVAAVYDPVKDGNLFVVGGHRSGKSTALAALAQAASNAVVVPSNAEGAWDAITEALAAVRAGAAPSLVLLDDLDLIVGRFTPEHESVFIERVMSLEREGPRAGTVMVITASALRGRVQAVSALSASTLVLRMRDRQEHVLVGGEAAEFSAQLPPGGGHWQGHRVQFCYSDPMMPTGGIQAPPLECSSGDTLVVVSTHPAALRSRLERLGQVTTLEAGRARHDEIDSLGVERGSGPTIILGDPDAWFSSSVLLSSLRSRSRLVFHDCSLTEFRSLSRIRELPPPLDSPHDTVVVLTPDGLMRRALLSE